MQSESNSNRPKRRPTQVAHRATQTRPINTNSSEPQWRPPVERRLNSSDSQMFLLAAGGPNAKPPTQTQWARKRRWRRPGPPETGKQRAYGLLGQLLILLVIIHQLALQTAAGTSKQQQQQHRRHLERRATDKSSNNADSTPTSRGSSFCPPQTVGHQQEPSGKKVFCFYDIQDDFRPQELNPCLCTHVVYSYVAVRKNLSFIAGKKGDLRSLASLKRKNPNLKLLVSLRPDDFFSFDALPPTATPAPMEAGVAAAASADGAPAATNDMHQKFAKRIRDFIVRHSLDGVNLDWPYFGQTLANANASREHLTLTLQAIEENFQSSLGQSSPSGAYLRLLQAPLVTLTVSKDFYSLVDAYDFSAINKLLDFVHLPAFDFDLNVDQFSIGHPARLHGIFDAENLDTLVDLLLSSGLASNQLVAGLPAHGVQITSRLSNSTTPTSANHSGSSSSLDEQLEAAASISIVSHGEVCRVRDLARQNCTASSGERAGDKSCWTMSRSRDLTAPFAYDSEHWIGFDDETSAKLKAKYVLLRHLAGAALFTANHDDPQGQCGFGPFPLLSVINGVFARQPPTTSGQLAAAASTTRGYFTRAPSQPLTATSLVAQIFGAKSRPDSSRNSADLMQSASDEVPRNHQQEGASADPATSAQISATGQLMSFVDIIEKYGSVQRLDARSRLPTGSSNEPNPTGQDPDSQLACERVGYQRYPRDCSRFYRCVQTPPVTGAAGSGSLQGAKANSPQQQQQNGAKSHNLAPSSITRLQYECPSGLVFDEQFQICNWPSWSAQCSGSGEVNSITNTKFVCPNYGYFQNQENCEYFYYCSDYNRGTTQAYQFRCPFELGFDEEKLQCNWKWLVKGCSNSNSTGASSTSQSSSTGGSNVELAQKYLASIESTATSSRPAAAATTVDSSAVNRVEQATSAPITTPTTVGPTELPTTELPSLGSGQPAPIGKRSLELDGSEFSGRGLAASIGSHVSSLLASAAAIREHRMKKANQAPGATSSKNTLSNGATSADSSIDRQTTKPAKYPSYIGLPQLASAPSGDSPLAAASSTGGSSLSTAGFRLRRRQQQQGANSPASEPDKQSVSASTPYRRRPAPASIFSFLPNSAIYMLADSLRSVGEAASDEINRYMRIAGDRMRQVLGHRAPGGKLKHKQRSTDHAHQVLESGLAKLALKLSSGGAARRLSVHNDGLANQANYHALVADQKRTKRVRRHTAALATDEMEDLQALESGPAGQQVYVASPSHHPQVAYQMKPPPQQQQQHYNDPLGRPPGYPLNALDSAAKQAVLGAEPKLFSQPSHLVINQLSGISQADYERLVGPQQQQQQHQANQQQYKSHQLRPPMAAAVGSYLDAPHQEAKNEPMMGAASEQVASQTQFIDHSKVIERILGQAREAFTIGAQAAASSGQQESVVPFGMPAMVRPLTANGEHTLSAQESKTTLSAAVQKPTQQKRRSTVAMKLATLGLPKFSLLPATTTTSTSTSAPPTSTGQPAAERDKASGSKYMSFLPSFIVNKAMGFNRAVQDLISTLAPGSSSKSHQQQAVSTPKMTQILPYEHQVRLQQHFQKQREQVQTTPLPMSTHNFQNGQHPMMQQHQQQQARQATLFNNRTSGPLLLTESEARALSAQLDQLSKEQLEALSSDLFKGDQSSLRAHIGQDYQHQVQKAKQQPAESGPSPQVQPATESADYVVRLLRMISQTSHNPEDVRLLEQLTSQLNNPRPNGQDQSLIEIGQPDDLALLEALGMIPSQPAKQQHQQQSARTQAKAQAAQQQLQQAKGPSDNRPEASYNNYQMAPNEIVPQHPYAYPGGMKPLLHQQDQQLHQQERQKHMNHAPQQPTAQTQLRHIENLPPLEIDNENLGTTKFIPIALDLQHEVTTPTPYHLQTSYEPQPTNQQETTYSTQPSYKQQPTYRPGPSYEPQVSYPPEQSHQPQVSYSSEPLHEPQVSYQPKLAYSTEPAYQQEPTYSTQSSYQPEVIYHPTSYQPKPTYKPESSYNTPQPLYEPLVSHQPELSFQQAPHYPKPSYGSPSAYNSPQPQFEYYTSATTTTTTTTTQRPTQIVTEVFQQQQLEKQAPPVRQTYTEIIENNVTTPDGIETTIESRTKSAISGSAAFGIGSQVGLGMIPSAFGGSVPSDSPVGELQAKQQDQTNGTASNTSSSTSGAPSSSSSSSPSSSSTKLEEKKTNSSEKQTATNGGSVSGVTSTQQFDSSNTSAGGAQQMGIYNLNSENLNNPDLNNPDFLAGLTDEQRQAIFNSQQLSDQNGAISAIESGNLEAEPLPSGEQFGAQQDFQFQQQPADEQQVVGPGQFAGAGQQTQFGASGARTATSMQTNQVLLQGGQQPLTSRQTESRFSGPQAPGGSLATLSSYNFATQPVNQMEEVIIKKKFKPFPKTMIVPQTSTFTIEEVLGDSKQGQQQPQLQQEVAQQQTEQQQIQQLAVSATDFSTSASASSQSVSSGSQQKAAQQEQIKEDDFSTVASTFGENAAASSATLHSGGSMTRSDLQRQQRIANDLKMIERQLKQQEASGQPIETLDPNSQVERESARLQSAVAVEAGAGSAKVSHKSGKKARKSQKQGLAHSSSTTRAPSAEPETETGETSTGKPWIENEDGSRPNKSSTSKRPRATANRAEEAFSNFMVELQRSRKPTNAKQTSASTSTTTTSSPKVATSKPDSIDASPSEQRNQRRRSRSKKTRHGQRASASQSEPTTSRKQTSKNRAKNRPKAPVNQVGVQGPTMGEPREREVAIYGTKSGFMPIISANDPSYATQPEVGPLLGNQLGSGGGGREQLSEPLSFGASFTSSKRQTLGGQESWRKEQDGAQVAPSATSNSWQNYFVRKLSDQISVVHLGNYSERNANHSSRLVQVKLVILPSSPNNQLLNPRNWQHLASSYPALFPRSLDELRVEIMDLGEPSIQPQNGGLIDERIERARHETLRAKYERISELIEPKTFKALDEIVQRSSGQLFMIQRRDSLDRTIIALIPDRHFIRSASPADGATRGYQRLVLTPSLSSTPSTTSTSTSTATSTSTTTSATPPAKETTPQRAATFSRAIQESIQEAIRQHYDSVKSQLRKSMAAGEQLDFSSSNRQQQQQQQQQPPPPPIDTNDEEYNRQRNWSIPAADALARIESSSNLQAAPLLLPSTENSAADPMEAASSSTEFSIVMAPTQSQQQPQAVAKESFGSQAMYEVEGAEPKTLYGLELNSNDRQQYEQERVRPAPEVRLEPTGTTEAGIKATLASQAAKPRFISIGSHLMASPMKKIVDQAYVNHFYDHISDHQLAKSIGFDESPEQQQQQPTSAAQNSTGVGDHEQQMSETAARKPEGGPSAEESLVPESACTRAGLFQHPFACNKFYECFWDKQLNKYTLHMFECPIKLAFDERIVGCAMPIESSLCVNM